MDGSATMQTTSRREFLKRIGLGAAGAALLPKLGNGAGPGPHTTPNFVIIVADDMGFSDAGCYGGDIATPNLDALAADGLRFTQFYSTGRCWPSRSCLMTGYYAQQVRMDPPRGLLPKWARLLPHHLKPLGYRCYHSGKWHIAGAPKPVADGGFDRSYVLHDHDHNFYPRDHWLDDQPLPPVAHDAGYYTTTAFTDRALEFLGEHTAQHRAAPFCLYLAYTVPHFPLQAPAEDIARYRGKFDGGWDVARAARWQRLKKAGVVNCALSALEAEVKPPWNLTPAQLAERIGAGEAPRAVPWQELNDVQRRFQAAKMEVHAAMIDRMDREIGRVIERLKQMDALENTVVLFVSDNGASAEQIIRGDGHDPAAAPGSAKTFLCLGPGWSSAANTPFRRHKSWVHEGGIASPLIVHWPRGIAARGELRHAPGHFVDVLPTVVELAGGRPGTVLNAPDTPPLPGRSFAAALAQDCALPRDCIFFHHLDNCALRVGDRKLVRAGKEAPWELYDLATDRCEQHDLAAAQPEKVQELAARWEKLEADYRKQAGPLPPEEKQRKKKQKPVDLALNDANFED
jgi:arylsulfatase